MTTVTQPDDGLPGAPDGFGAQLLAQVPPAHRAELAEILKKFRAEFTPEGYSAERLVEELAHVHWLQRLASDRHWRVMDVLEAVLLDPEADTRQLFRMLTSSERYEGQLCLRYFRILRGLIALQRQRRRDKAVDDSFDPTPGAPRPVVKPKPAEPTRSENASADAARAPVAAGAGSRAAPTASPRTIAFGWERRRMLICHPGRRRRPGTQRGASARQ